MWDDVAALCPEPARVAMSEADLARLHNLRSMPRVQPYAPLLAQLERMEHFQVKAELQALRTGLDPSAAGVSLTDFVLRKLVRRSWVPLE